MMGLSNKTERACVSPEDLTVEPRSFEQVFADEHQAMVRLAFLLVGSEAIAEEAVQDAFARLLDRWESIESPGGFVRTATLNRCRDLLRRRKTATRFVRLWRPDPVPELGDHYITDLLAGLRRDRREVLVLRFYLGHTTAEIAQLLGIPEGTVRSRMHRGIDELRGELA